MGVSIVKTSPLTFVVHVSAAEPFITYQVTDVNLDIDQAAGSAFAEPVPTVSEWGLVVIGLLLLIGATVVLGFRRPALVGMNGAPFAFAPRLPLFAAPLFARCLGIAVALLAVILALVIWREGSVAATDLIGSSLTTVGVAYLVHLWVLLRRGGPQA